MKPVVIIISETIWQSVLKDAITFSFILAMVSLGIALNSRVLEVIGGVMALTFIFAMVVNDASDRRMTIEQARARLDAIERGMK